MAAITGTVIAAGTALYSANQQKKAGERGAQAQIDAANMSVAEQQRQYNQTRADMEPFRQAGVGALSRQEQVLSGDYSGFEKSPDYLYALESGIKGLDRSAAARGNLNSGGHSADLMKLGQGLATQNLNNYWSKLAGQAGQGYSATSNLGSLGANMATNIGNAYGNAGNARASSYQQSADANSQLAAGLGGMFNNYLQNRQASGTGYIGWGGI